MKTKICLLVAWIGRSGHTYIGALRGFEELVQCAGLQWGCSDIGGRIAVHRSTNQFVSIFGAHGGAASPKVMCDPTVMLSRCQS